MQVLPTVASISSPESDRRIGHEAEANTEGRHTKVCKARYKAQARACKKRYCAGIGRRHSFRVKPMVGGTGRLLY